MFILKVKHVLSNQSATNSFRRFSSKLSLVEPISKFTVQNEPIKSYLKGSPERNELEIELKNLAGQTIEVPIIIDGKEHRTDLVRYQVLPFDHNKKLAQYYWATPELINSAISTASFRKEQWERVPMTQKIDIMLKAGDLAANQYRAKLNAATILGQAKTIVQAEIDAACELADFFRFNAYFCSKLHDFQPINPTSDVKNTFRYRGIDGFVAAVTPFNFTAIGGNLASSPALMGNCVLWKPSDTAILSNYVIYQLLVEAGLPEGVINFLPADGPLFGNTITKSKHLGGVNFTGSVATFSWLWKAIASNLDSYDSFPRLVGECGGKNFHFVHPSADLKTVVASTVRSAFEFSGQKCSACSRLYLPKSVADTVLNDLANLTNQLQISTPLDHKTYTSAVIDRRAFDRITSYINYANNSPNCKVIQGGEFDATVGYYIKPTIVVVNDVNDKLLNEEIFGPLLSVYVYDDKELDYMLDHVKNSTKYALTGSIFAKDSKFLAKATEELKFRAGNFYVNDKSTGSVVGQQPFGGSRKSGTNDKAGGPHFLLRWTSPQNVKETFVPQTEWRYKYMDE